MKRTAVIVAALLILLGIAGAGAGWVVGVRAEKGYFAGLAELNGQMVGVQLENVSYDRGLFRSQARTVLRVEDEAFVFEHRISHTPQPGVRVETRFAPGEDVHAFLAEQKLEELINTPIVTEVDFSGRSRSSYRLPAFSREFTEANGESVAIESRGIDLSFDLSADLRDLGGRLSLPYLRIVGNGGLLEIKEIRSELDTGWKQGLALGRSRMTMESFLFELDGEPRSAAFSLQGLNMSSHNDIVDEFYGGMVRLDARELMLGGRSFGPMEFEIALEKLAVSSLQRLQAEVENLNRAVDPQQAQMQLMMAMGEIIPELLGHRPRLVLKTVGLKGEEGDIRGEGMATFEGDIASPDLKMLLAGLVANFDLDISRGLLNSLIMSAQYLKAGQRPGSDEQLDGMIAQVADMTIEQLKGRYILVGEGERLKLNFHLDKMQPILNGRPLAL